MTQPFVFFNQQKDSFHLSYIFRIDCDLQSVRSKNKILGQVVEIG